MHQRRRHRHQHLRHRQHGPRDPQPGRAAHAARGAELTSPQEPELVETSAEPGAEDGAGAAITVQEPWAGYGG